MTRPRPAARATVLGALALPGLLALGLAGLAPAATAAPAGAPALAPALAPAGVSTLAAARARAVDTKARLDGKGRTAPPEVTGWYVDDATAQVVVTVTGPATVAADSFSFVGVDPTSVRVEPGAEPARPLARPRPTAGTDLVGGEAIYGGGVRCSVGFSVRSATTTGMITAGHCTDEGGPWSGRTGRTIGPVAVSRFPVDDYGLVTDTDTRVWRPSGRIQSGPTVTGSAVAPVGARVCRSGSTTGYKCGTILSLDQTVNYGDGDLVYGLTRTSVCAEPGDSGGSFVTPDTRQAQGTLSGGTGDCRRTAGVTFFQPINEVLAATGTTLVTGS